MAVIARIILTLLVACAMTAASASAAPKPNATPGGANQMSAISGKVGQTLWNGQIRFKLVEVREATVADHPESIVPLPTQKVLVVTAIIRNGTPGTWANLVTYTLADKDEVTVELPAHFFTPPSLTIGQAASAKQTALVPVDKTFVPVKLIFTCGTCGKSFKAVRVTLNPPSQ